MTSSAPRKGRPPKTDPTVISHHIDARVDEVLDRPQARGDEEDLLNPAQVALWLGLGIGWLNRGRCKGYGPRYIRLSPNRVVYRRGDVRDWIASRTTTPRPGGGRSKRVDG